MESDKQLKQQNNSNRDDMSMTSTDVSTLNEEKEILDIGLLLDCTGSMSSWIKRAQQTLNTIVDDAVQSCDGKLRVRVSFVGYRDHKDQQRFEIKQFTENIKEIKQFISSVNAVGGNDFPEDVTGGMRKCLDQDWSEVSTKQVFHIFDAPCHGIKYHQSSDDYPRGCPEGLILEDLMKEFKDKDIGYSCIKVNNKCDIMIKAMLEVYNEMEVQDLSKYDNDEDLTQNFQQEAKMAMLSNMCKTQKRHEQEGRGRMVINLASQKMVEQRIQQVFQPNIQSNPVKKDQILTKMPKQNIKSQIQNVPQFIQQINTSEKDEQKINVQTKQKKRGKF